MYFHRYIIEIHCPYEESAFRYQPYLLRWKRVCCISTGENRTRNYNVRISQELRAMQICLIA